MHIPEHDIENNVYEIYKMAKQTDSELVMKKPDNLLIRFKRDDVTIDVWYSKMTVGIYVDNIDTCRYLYDVSMDDLFEIFMSPIGYKHNGRVKETYKYNGNR
jgi:hypothetical protein